MKSIKVGRRRLEKGKHLGGYPISALTRMGLCRQEAHLRGEETDAGHDLPLSRSSYQQVWLWRLQPGGLFFDTRLSTGPSSRSLCSPPPSPSPLPTPLALHSRLLLPFNAATSAPTTPAPRSSPTRKHRKKRRNRKKKTTGQHENEENGKERGEEQEDQDDNREEEQEEEEDRGGREEEEEEEEEEGEEQKKTEAAREEQEKIGKYREREQEESEMGDQGANFSRHRSPTSKSDHGSNGTCKRKSTSSTKLTSQAEESEDKPRSNVNRNRQKLQNTSSIVAEQRKCPSESVFRPMSRHESTEHERHHSYEDHVNTKKILVESKEASRLEESSTRGDARDGSKDSKVVKVRGLPWEVTREDIVDFFATLDIDEPEGISIALHFDGRPTGDGFIRFVSAEHASRAVQK